MKNSFIRLLITCIMILLLPYLITKMHHNENRKTNTIIPYDGRLVLMDDTTSSLPIDYNEYLFGMTARNLVSFDQSIMDNSDFIRLNILIANTFLTSQFANSTVLTEEFLSEYYIPDDELRLLWGSQYDNYRNQIYSLISTLQNEALFCGDTLITPYFHRISSGITRLGNETLNAPYLKSVDTNLDIEENGFLSIVTLKNSEFINTILANYPDTFKNTSLETINDKIQIISKNLDYVESLQIGQLQMTGETFAKLFGLNSTAFTLTFQKDTLKIIVKGVGHGYGISLSYAYNMLSNGSTLEDVIHYFYQNVEIKNIK